MESDGVSKDLPQRITFLLVAGLELLGPRDPLTSVSQVGHFL